MRFSSTTRIAALLLLADAGVSARAQGGTDSPYSAYGFGDLVSTSQVSQALMGGTGVAFTEPFSVVLGNPASYTGLYRPVFEANVAARSTRFSSSAGNVQRKDAGLSGFSIGVPFARGRWGMALGLAPYSDVGYTTTQQRSFDGGDIKYQYVGSGGLDRAFFGLGRVLHQQRADSVGNLGTRMSVGANFDFLFGSIEQTRDAIYPAGAEFSSTRAFSTLVLRAPTADLGLLWQGDLTKRKVKDTDNWRYTVGVNVQLPTVFTARHQEFVNSYALTTNNLETFRDTIGEPVDTRGTVDVPVGFGVGASVQSERWMFTAEVRARDWSGTKVDVNGYGLPAPLRNAMSYAVGARFKPANEGGLFQRTIYRAGARYGNDYLEVQGRGLTRAAITGGISIPVNAVQSSSYVHIGGEVGRRGTTSDGLIEERYATLWIGITLTPWKGERWFVPPKIQ